MTADVRVFAFSDLHVDYPANLADIRALSDTDYRDDALLLAGDVTDDLTLLRETLVTLRDKFARVFYVPGNHELWDRQRRHAHAIERFDAVLALAHEARVECAPARLHGRWGAVWIVPLFSWYRRPGEGVGSLYVPKRTEQIRQRWTDDRLIRWPGTLTERPADYFLRLNLPAVRTYPGPVITFSHFLPRRELMFPPVRLAAHRALRDPHPGFNFSRVAGCSLLDEQIRRIGAQVHVYGHQHRNRDARIDGVRYVSHCMGYPRERERGYLRPDAMAPLCVWRSRDQARHAVG